MMINPQPANSQGSFRRRVGKFAKTWTPGNVKNGKAGRKKDPVNSRQRTMRMKRISQRAMLLLLLPFVAVCSGGLVYAMLLQSDIFRITNLSVLGNQVTSQEQILKAAGLRRGINLLTLDTQETEALIAKEQWVDMAWVKRHWPSTVEVIVQEYKPFALINLERDGNRQLYYMDKKGVVFAPSTAKRDLDYPVINGSLHADSLQGKKIAEGTSSDLALDFLKLTAKGNQILPTQAVSEINIDEEGSLVVFLVDHPFPIYMGNEKIKLRFNRLLKVLAKLYEDEEIKGVAEIRMDYDDDKILVARVDERQ